MNQWAILESVRLIIELAIMSHLQAELRADSYTSGYGKIGK